MTSKPKTDNDAEPMRTGARCLIEGLERAGCKTLFAYPGGAILDVFHELASTTMKVVLPRHEQGAAHMADAYARATGEVGCCLVTSGPGATNTVTGLATANMDGIPMVCVTGVSACSAARSKTPPRNTSPLTVKLEDGPPPMPATVDAVRCS